MSRRGQVPGDEMPTKTDFRVDPTTGGAEPLPHAKWGWSGRHRVGVVGVYRRNKRQRPVPARRAVGRSDSAARAVERESQRCKGYAVPGRALLLLRACPSWKK